MFLEENPESIPISSYADLAWLIGRRVSINQAEPDSWYEPPDLIHFDGNASIDYEHTPSAYPKTFVACADLPRIEGTLRRFSNCYGVAPDQNPRSFFYLVNERNFHAADPRLLD